MANKAFTLSTIFSAIDRLSGPTKTMTASVQKFQKVTKGLGTAGKIVAGAGKAILGVGAAAVGAMIAVERMLTPFAEKGDEIAKSARMFGMTTDALQELRYAAGMQGVETESLNDAFKQLNNNLGQLKASEGALYSRLTNTNPELARQLRTAEDTDAAFMLMMEAIEAEGDAAKRAALAQAAFGRSGQELIKFADAGAEGIAALRAEAHRYGLVVSQEAANASEAYSDSLSRLKQAAGSLFNNVLGQAVTRVQPVIQAMADWIAQNRELIGQRIDKVASVIGEVFATVGPIIAKAFQVLAPVLGKVLGLLKPVLEIFSALAPVIEIVASALSAVLGPVLDAIAWTIDKLAKGLALLMNFKAGDAGTAGGSLASQAMAAGGIPTSPNTPAMESRSFSESRSILDVNFNNAPAGTSYRQSGAAPGITLNTGRLTP